MIQLAWLLKKKVHLLRLKIGKYDEKLTSNKNKHYRTSYNRSASSKIFWKNKQAAFSHVKVKNVIKSIATLFRTSAFFKRFSCRAKEQTRMDLATTQLDKSKCFLFTLFQVRRGTGKSLARLIKCSFCFFFYKKLSLCFIYKQKA